MSSSVLSSSITILTLFYLASLYKYKLIDVKPSLIKVRFACDYIFTRSDLIGSV